MKKFKDIGYTVYRDDYSQTYGHLKIRFVHLDQESDWRDGTQVARLVWQTGDNKKSWYALDTSVGTGRGSHTDQYRYMQEGMHVLKFVIKHFGYSVPDEIACNMPSADAMVLAKKNLAEDKEYTYEGALSRLQPEVLVWIGLPALGIPRVVFDKRFRKTVLADQVEFPELSRWRAVSDFENWIGAGLALDYFTAQNAVEEEVRGELMKLDSVDIRGYPRHGGLKWCWGSNKEAYREAAIEWLESGRPVTQTGEYAPEVTSLEELLDIYRRYLNGAQF